MANRPKIKPAAISKERRARIMAAVNVKRSAPKMLARPQLRQVLSAAGVRKQPASVARNRQRAAAIKQHFDSLGH